MFQITDQIKLIVVGIIGAILTLIIGGLGLKYYLLSNRYDKLELSFKASEMNATSQYQKTQNVFDELKHANDRLDEISVDRNKSIKTYTVWKESPPQIRYVTIYKQIGEINATNDCNQTHDLLNKYRNIDPDTL